MASTPERWEVEDDAFWQSTGKSIANRNLWISIPNLLCGFSVWLYWGMIAKTMQRLHFANTDLFNFTFKNDGQPYDEARLSGTPVHTARCGGASGGNATDSQLVYDRHLRWTKCQVHDDRHVNYPGAAHRDSA